MVSDTCQLGANFAKSAEMWNLRTDDRTCAGKAIIRFMIRPKAVEIEVEFRIDEYLGPIWQFWSRYFMQRSRKEVSAKNLSIAMARKPST